MEVLKKTALLRLQKQTEGLQPEDVTTISLSGVPLLPDMLSPFHHLTHLTLVCMKPRLMALTALPLQSFVSLRLLDVSDNAITISEDLPKCRTLKRLGMPNNKVTSIAEVQRLAVAFPELEVLDLADNAVSIPERFKDIFSLFSKLVALDSKTRDGEEVIVEDSDESLTSSGSGNESESYSEASSEKESESGSRGGGSDSYETASSNEMPQKQRRME